MSSFHVYHSNQFKVIPLACTLRTRNIPQIYKKPPQIFRNVGRGLMAQQITLTAVSRRQPVTINYRVT